MKSNIVIDYFMRGGVFMYPLLFFLFVSLFFIIERGIYFFIFDWRISVTVKMLSGKSIFDRIIKSNFDSFGTSIDSFNMFMENDCNAILSSLENNLNYLTAMATLAPITGFLGTVSGMIIAFRDITLATDVSPQLVAGGIYEALITTAFGLIITIIASFFYFLFQNIIRKYALDMEVAVNNILKIIEDDSINSGREYEIKE